MQAKEFGKEHERKIVLIPGNMMSWRQFKNVIPIKHLEKMKNLTLNIEIVLSFFLCLPP